MAIQPNLHPIIHEPKSSLSISKPWRYSKLSVAESSFETLLAVTCLAVGILTLAALANQKLAQALKLGNSKLLDGLLGGALLLLTPCVSYLAYKRLQEGKNDIYDYEMNRYNLAERVKNVSIGQLDTIALVPQKINDLLRIVNTLRQDAELNGKILMHLDGPTNVMKLFYDSAVLNEYGIKDLNIVSHAIYKVNQLVAKSHQLGSPLYFVRDRGRGLMTLQKDLPVELEGFEQTNNIDFSLAQI